MWVRGPSGVEPVEERVRVAFLDRWTWDAVVPARKKTPRRVKGRVDGWSE